MNYRTRINFVLVLLKVSKVIWMPY